MQSLWQDLRFGLRKLLKTPGSTLVIVLTLALGIGASTTIFSVVHGVLLSPLPYVDGGELLRLRQRAPLAGVDDMRFSVKEIRDYREQNHTLDAVVEYHSMSFTLLGGEEPYRVQTGVVSTEFFDVLGVAALHGRAFLPGEDTPTADPVMVLSYDFWQTLTGGDPAVVGQTYEMNDRVHTVVGVLPPVTLYPGRDDVYVPTSACPFRSSERMIEGRDLRMMSVLGRKKDDVPLASVRADLATIAARLARSYPDSYSERAGYEMTAVPALEDLTKNARAALWILLGVTGLVLLIVAANVANLVLARLVHRERELAVRAALGAGRGRLSVQLLTESLLLSLAGGALGLVVAFRGLDLLMGYAANFTPRAGEVGIDAAVLAFTLAVSLLTGIGFGTVPALLGARSVNDALRDGSHASAGRGRQRLKGLLLVAQVGLACVLLIGAGLMLRSLDQLLRVDPGYDPENVLSATLSLPFSRYTDGAARFAFYDRLLRRLDGHPGVVAAAMTRTTPMTGGPMNVTFEIENRPLEDDAPRPAMDYRTVTPDYFRLLGVPLLAGRLFGDGDGAEAPPVAIVNRALARRYWEGDPIGQRVSADGGETWATIVGLVGDVKQYGLTEEAPEALYAPFAQSPIGNQILVRTTADPLPMTADLRDLVRELDPDQPIAYVRTLEQVRLDSIGRERLITVLLSLFAGLALVVTATGIAALAAFSVSQRTQEIGIRMALGARRRSVVALVMGQGLALVAVGLAAGLAAAVFLSRLLADQLFGVTSTDPWTYGAVALGLALVAAAACLVPARRATAIDPWVALRSE